MNKHDGQSSNSPSIQIKEATLQAAHLHAFAIHKRHNGEIAVAFRPEFFVDYALNSASLHKTGKAEIDMSLLNGLDDLTDEKIDLIKNVERKIIISKIARKYREQDFRRRVLGAYQHQCAMCGVQLELIDAAHIIPVAAPTSTDETINGIALCKLHHAAFDRNLISFNENYKIEVSSAEENRLSAVNLVGGLKEFKKNLKSAIILPADKRDYPKSNYIKEARSVRKWMA
jgi:putative restriction endonuclease